jgi:hypothetical protein
MRGILSFASQGPASRAADLFPDEVGVMGAEAQAFKKNRIPSPKVIFLRKPVFMFTSRYELTMSGRLY